MTKVDQFESVFRSALRDGFHYQPIDLKTAMLVTDMDHDASAVYLKRVQDFLANAPGLQNPKWEMVDQSAFKSTESLLERVAKSEPQLICTYRNLHSQGWKYPHSLGEHLDVLLQKTPAPVLVLPHPEAEDRAAHAMAGTHRILVMTDHLANDHLLINHALAFATPEGALSLVHIEDGKVFRRYMDAISKIPAIDTHEAETRIRKQLLKEPHDFIASCRNTLERAGIHVQIKEIIAFGDRLAEYKSHVDQNKTELLVMNTKDREQLAMHGLAYPLAIELRQIPILML